MQAATIRKITNYQIQRHTIRVCCKIVTGVWQHYFKISFHFNCSNKDDQKSVNIIISTTLLHEITVLMYE